MQIKSCPKCGGKLKLTTTHVTRERNGEMVTIVDVPVARCGQCGEEILQRPQDIEDFIAQKKEADMAVGFLDKLYFSNRWLFYLVGLISLALLAVAVYIFFKG